MSRVLVVPLRDNVKRSRRLKCQIDGGLLNDCDSVVLQKYWKQETHFGITTESLSALIAMKVGSVQVGTFIYIIQCGDLAVWKGFTPANRYHF